MNTTDSGHIHPSQHDPQTLAQERDYANRTLFLCNIPPKSNSIPHLIAHYRKFGHIDAINCSGTHATILFEKEESAKAALESPLTVLRNRFIKITLQDPELPNAALLTANCPNLQEAKDAAEQSMKNAKFEEEETQSIRAELKREADMRKHQQAKLEVSKIKSEMDLMLKETEEILLQMSGLDKEMQTKKKNRLSSLYLQINSSERRIHDLENSIQEFEAKTILDEVD